MYHFQVSLILLAFWQAVDATPGVEILEPVSDANWGDVTDRRVFRRDSSKLELQDSEHFLWTGKSNNSNIFVNMTMQATEDERILSMERFSNEISSVSCSMRNMMITFKSNSSYQSAISSWNWVNNAKKHKVVMVSKWQGCGDGSSRQPWEITGFKYDPARLLVQLNATKKTWEKVASDYDVDFGQVAPAPPTDHCRSFKRSLLGKEVSLNLARNLPSALVQPISFGGFSLSVGCLNCKTKGSLLLSGHVEVRFFIPKSFTVSASPKGVEVDLSSLQLELIGSLTDSWSPPPFPIANFPVGGIQIPGLLSLGPTVGLSLGVEVGSLSLSTVVSTGVVGKIPDSAIFKMGSGVKNLVEASGWEPIFETTPVSLTATASVNAHAFFQLSVALNFVLLGNGIDVALDLQVPDVSIAAAVIQDTKGVCADKTKQMGVTIDSSVGVVLQAVVNQAFSFLGLLSTDFNKNITLAEARKTLPSVCKGFGLNV